jgi:ubiquitin carboxyl-terminal hydrolase 4/11/15
MDPENEADKTRDVDMGSLQVNESVEGPSQPSSADTLPRAMSVDAPEPAAPSAGDASPSQRKAYVLSSLQSTKPQLTLMPQQSLHCKNKSRSLRLF